MAEVILTAAAAAAKYVGGVVVGLTGSPLAGVVASGVAGGTVIAGVTLGLNAVARAQLPDPEVGKLSLRQSRPQRKILMGGPSRVGGAYMHWETSASTLGIVVALQDGRLHEIQAIYLHDDVVTRDGDGWVQEGADGRFGAGDLIQIKTRLGLPTETHYSEMTAKFSATWPTTARGDGIASLMMLATHRSRESFPKHFPNGEPNPSVVAVPVCYDWRDEAQDREDESTWGPCANPVVWLVHHEWYRCGRSWDRVIAPVLDALTIEADLCDESVARVGGTEPRYAFAGWYTADVQPQTRRAALLATFDGWMSHDAQGRLVVKAGRYEAPTVTITGDHIVGYDWRAFSPEEERVNKLVVTYTDPGRDYTETEADPWLDQADIDAAGVERDETLALQWVQSRSQARRLAKRKMSRLKAERRGQIITDLSGLNAWGQRYVRIQNPELASMADVVVEVMGAEFAAETGTCTFDVILADTAIDDWDPATEEGAAAGGSTRPGPAALTDPVIDDITPFYEDNGGAVGVRLSIEATGPNRPDLTWFVRWRVDGATSWVESLHTDEDPGTSVTLVTGFVTADATLDVEVAYLTGGGSRSDWSATDTISTSTASVAPGAVTEFSAADGVGESVITGRAPTTANLAYVRIFRNTTTDFGTATQVGGDLTPALGALFTYTNTGLSAGTYQFWAVAYNAGGVASAVAGPDAAVIT